MASEVHCSGSPQRRAGRSWRHFRAVRYAAKGAARIFGVRLRAVRGRRSALEVERRHRVVVQVEAAKRCLALDDRTSGARRPGPVGEHSDPVSPPVAARRVPERFDALFARGARRAGRDGEREEQPEPGAPPSSSCARAHRLSPALRRNRLPSPRGLSSRSSSGDRVWKLCVYPAWRSKRPPSSVIPSSAAPEHPRSVEGVVSSRATREGTTVVSAQAPISRLRCTGSRSRKAGVGATGSRAMRSESGLQATPLRQRSPMSTARANRARFEPERRSFAVCHRSAYVRGVGREDSPS